MTPPSFPQYRLGRFLVTDRKLRRKFLSVKVKA